MIDRLEFDRLATRRGQWLVSIYLPKDSVGVATPKDLLHLRHLVEAMDSLASGGHQAKVFAKAIADRIAGVDRLELFGEGRGVALLASPADLRTISLTNPVEELLFVGERFCLRPLFAQLDGAAPFHVLALSQKAVRLVECDAHGERELALGAVSEGLADTLHESAERVLQSHSTSGGGGGRPSQTMHGQGGAADAHKDELRRFFRLVDEAVIGGVGSSPPPLVIAAVGYAAELYREVSRHPRIVAAAIEGSPDRSSCAQLREGAGPIVCETLEAPRRAIVSRVLAGIPTGTSITEVAAILNAAHQGRLADLLMRATPALWGAFDADSGTARLHDEYAPDDDDLLDLAMSKAIGSGARVLAVDAATLPGGVPMVATLRG